MKGALNPKRGNLSSTESVHRVKKKKKKKKYIPKRLLFMVNKIFLGKAIFFLMSGKEDACFIKIKGPLLCKIIKFCSTAVILNSGLHTRIEYVNKFLAVYPSSS